MTQYTLQTRARRSLGYGFRRVLLFLPWSVRRRRQRFLIDSAYYTGVTIYIFYSEYLGGLHRSPRGLCAYGYWKRRSPLTWPTILHVSEFHSKGLARGNQFCSCIAAAVPVSPTPPVLHRCNRFSRLLRSCDFPRSAWWRVHIGTRTHARTHAHTQV